tara:strand:- start:660 stop:2039 length:1380 start_codon:yes stop_codon:yes gene_type:complete
MDDIIKLLQQLIASKPKPKGGIASSQEGIEFLGKVLTKEQRGNLMVVGSRLTDASRFKPFSVANIGRDKRYRYIFEYERDLAGEFNKTIRFLKENPDIRLSQTQRDNIIYNLGVFRRVTEEKNKLEKGIISEGKKPEDIYAAQIDEAPVDELSLEGALDKFKDTQKKLKKAMDDLEKGFKTEKITDEKKLRLKRLYDGPGFDRPNSPNYRGYGSFFLPKLHEKGIINLNDKIYENLVKGAHHYSGADFFAPDPVRIWRKHFGNEVFEKLDNFDPDNEDIFQWLERNNIQPIQKEGPKNALEYLTPTEIQQQLTDDLKLFSVYKKPTDEASQGYIGIDDPEFRMNQIVRYGEEINEKEKVLQTLDPDSFREYIRTKPRFDSKILPFKDLNAEGGRVGFSEGSFYDNILQLEDDVLRRVLDAFKYYQDHGGKKNLRDYLRGAGKKGDQFRGAKGGIVGLRI